MGSIIMYTCIGLVVWISCTIVIMSIMKAAGDADRKTEEWRRKQ